MSTNADSRPVLDEYFARMAEVVSSRASCIRRSVGCVLVDAFGHVLSTGYNGPPSGVVNCTSVACHGAGAASGTDLHACQAIHAEQNALLQCRDVRDIYTCYATTSPCMHCVKLLANTGCSRIVYIDEYPDVEDVRTLWHRVISARMQIDTFTWIHKFNALELYLAYVLAQRRGHPTIEPAETLHWGPRWNEPIFKLVR